MNYILISRLQVQNANAIAGFTYGFPSITHFLGFTHAIERKLKKIKQFDDIHLTGCAVIAHEHCVHTYGKYNDAFIQSRNPPYLASHDKSSTPPVIEEGKMNMTVSLIVGCKTDIGNRRDDFIEWLEKACATQHLAGGSILNEKLDIDIYAEDADNLKLIKRKLLPGFFLMDKSNYLKEHYEELCRTNPETELINAWMDFAVFKKKARPSSDLIIKHIDSLLKSKPQDDKIVEMQKLWQAHLSKPYDVTLIPGAVLTHFSAIEPNKTNKDLLQQWQEYCAPHDKTDAIWEPLPKPRMGFLVPIMSGYKAISSVYQAGEVKNTRDIETPVCFVESVHSVGEWKSVHRIKVIEELNLCLWYYDYEENWYLCKQLEPTLHTGSEDLELQKNDSELSFY